MPSRTLEDTSISAKTAMLIVLRIDRSFSMTEFGRSVIPLCIIFSAFLATDVACTTTRDNPSGLIPPIEKDLVDQQVQKGLTDLEKLKNDPKNYDLYARYAKVLGFSTVEEAATAKIGKHLPVY